VGASLAASEAGAVKTSYWKTESVTQLLKGDVVNVSVDSDANVKLGPAWNWLATQLEGVSYIWCLARDSRGRVYFGTGDNGRIYRWTTGRGTELVWQTGAAEITSMAIDASDNLYAGSTPGGVIFRVGAKGDTTRYYKTGEESVWSLLIGRDGALYAGTGSRGRLFKVTGPGQGTVYAETRDVNVLALGEAKDGALLAGTSSKGLLVRVERSGSVRVLYDGDSEEIRAIAVLGDGSIVVGTNRPKGSGSPGGASGGIEVTPPGAGGKCGVFLVQPDGSARLLYAPPTDWVYALLPVGDGSVYVATGDPAALFRVGTDRKYELLGAPESKQLLALVRAGNQTYAASGNAAALYTLGSGPANEGTFISEAHDLRSVASWGKAAVRMSGSGDVLWSTRSGLSDTPDDGWSPWSRETSAREQPQIESPAARFLQYRLRLKGGGGQGPVISSVEVAFLQRNLPPEITRVTLYGPSQPFFEGGAEYRPPQISQSYPDGMKLEFSLPRSGPRPVSDASAAWARGIRSVAWEAGDPNGDDLVYRLYIKADGEKEWRLLGEDIQDRAFSWDAESFSNGQYRLKLKVSDSPDNPPEVALDAERLSAPFQIDNVPPRVESLEATPLPAKRGVKGGVIVRGVAVDADTRISRIEYSLDGGDWRQIFPEDGIFDALRESFRFQVGDLEPGEHAVTVRASDLDRNVAVAKVLVVTP